MRPLLKLVARSLTSIVRESDIVGRLGGDEFAIIATLSDQERAIDLVNRINVQLAKIALPTGAYSHKVSSSVGIALFPHHGEDVFDLMAAADLAMYQANDLAVRFDYS